MPSGNSIYSDNQEIELALLKAKAVFDKEYFGKLCSRTSLLVLYGFITVFLSLTVYNLHYTHTFDLEQAKIGSRLTLLESVANSNAIKINNTSTTIDAVKDILINKLAKQQGEN